MSLVRFLSPSTGYIFKNLISQNFKRFYSKKNIEEPSICEHLSHRSLIKISGSESLQFLQGLVTNDVRHLTENNATSVNLPCIYSMMLNVQGRLMYDIFLYKDIGNNIDHIWLECDSSISNDLIQYLKKYRVRRKIEIVPVPERKVWWIYKGNLAQNIKENNIIVGDPRLSDLGYRCILESPDEKPPYETQTLYTALRYSLGVGEGVKELSPGNSFPLECNGDYLHGVSFQKGCYIGQELTSRVHHTGVVRKRIMPFKILTSSKEVLIGGTITNEIGRNLGKVLGLFGDTGIALIRIEEAGKAKEVYVGEDKIKIEVIKPNWWPLEMSKI